MRTKRSQVEWRGGRGGRAWERKEQGWKQQDIAAALGGTSGAVSQWLKRAREQGVAGRRRHPARGRQPRSTAEQVAQLPALLERGAEAYGLRGQVWTCKRVAAVIRRTFGVTSHPAHVSRRLHAVRHSVQRPVTRATQRNATTITAWWQARWPALEKKRPTRGAPSSGEFNRASICYPWRSVRGRAARRRRCCGHRSRLTAWPPSGGSTPPGRPSRSRT